MPKGCKGVEVLRIRIQRGLLPDLRRAARSRETGFADFCQQILENAAIDFRASALEPERTPPPIADAKLLSLLDLKHDTHRTKINHAKIKGLLGEGMNAATIARRYGVSTGLIFDYMRRERRKSQPPQPSVAKETRRTPPQPQPQQACDFSFVEELRKKGRSAGQIVEQYSLASPAALLSFLEYLNTKNKNNGGEQNAQASCE